MNNGSGQQDAVMVPSSSDDGEIIVPILPDGLRSALDRLESAYPPLPPAHHHHHHHRRENPRRVLARAPVGGVTDARRVQRTGVNVASVNTVPDAALSMALKRYVRRVALALCGAQGTGESPLSPFSPQIPYISCRHDARGRVVTAAVTVSWSASTGRSLVSHETQHNANPWSVRGGLGDMGTFLAALLTHPLQSSTAAASPESDVQARGIRLRRAQGCRFAVVDLNPETGSVLSHRAGMVRPRKNGHRSRAVRDAGPSALVAAAAAGKQPVVYSVTLTLNRCVGCRGRKRKRPMPAALGHRSRGRDTEDASPSCSDRDIAPPARPRKRMRRVTPTPVSTPPLAPAAYDADTERRSESEDDLVGGGVRATDPDFWFPAAQEATDPDPDQIEAALSPDTSRAMQGFPQGTAQDRQRRLENRLSVLDNVFGRKGPAALAYGRQRHQRDQYQNPFNDRLTIVEALPPIGVVGGPGM